MKLYVVWKKPRWVLAGRKSFLPGALSGHGPTGAVRERSSRPGGTCSVDREYLESFTALSQSKQSWRVYLLSFVAESVESRRVQSVAGQVTVATLRRPGNKKRHKMRATAILEILKNKRIINPFSDRVNNGCTLNLL